MGYYKVECPNCDNIYKLHEDFNCVNCGKNGILKMDSATSATPDDNTYGCGKCRVQWEWIECPNCGISINGSEDAGFITLKWSFKNYNKHPDD